MFKSWERRLQTVKRWAILPTLFQQSVAEHSFYVALYTDKLCLMLSLRETTRRLAVSMALRHDMEEVMHGDIPGPAKKRMGLDTQVDKDAMVDAAGDDYTDMVHPDDAYMIGMIVKFADKLEAAMFLQKEVMTGNSAVGDILRSHVGWLKDHAKKIGLTDAQIGQIVGDIHMAHSIRLPL